MSPRLALPILPTSQSFLSSRFSLPTLFHHPNICDKTPLHSPGDTVADALVILSSHTSCYFPPPSSPFLAPPFGNPPPSLQNQLVIIARVHCCTSSPVLAKISSPPPSQRLPLSSWFCSFFFPPSENSGLTRITFRCVFF